MKIHIKEVTSHMRKTCGECRNVPENTRIEWRETYGTYNILKIFCSQECLMTFVADLYDTAMETYNLREKFKESINNDKNRNV